MAPVITLNGLSSLTLECSLDAYLEEGASLIEACDPNVTVTIGGDTVNASAVGVYVVSYDATDAAGNAAIQVTRTITVQDTTAPTITLLGVNPQILECPSPYVELGATAIDTCDLNLGAVVIDASAVDANIPGTYVVTYNISDTSGNAATPVQRTVVVQDSIAPIITLNGLSSLSLECHVDVYLENGAGVTDACDPNVAVIIGGDTVDANTVGAYVVTYDAIDVNGNAADQVTRTITVQDTTAPTITLAGDNPVILETLESYVESGATASDFCHGDLTASIVIDSSEVDVLTPGSYNVFYTSVDPSGNTTIKTRSVQVLDTTPPVITLIGDSDILILQNDIYVEEGAIASDDTDANVVVVVGGDVVDTSVIDVYIVDYDAVDASGNVAETQVRTVTVIPRFAAVDGLFGCLEVKLHDEAIVQGSLASMHKVDLKKETQVAGNIINVTGVVDVQGNALIAGNIDAGGKVTIHRASEVGMNVISGEKIELKSYTHVFGDATSAGQVKITRSAVVDGIVSEDQVIEPLIDIPLPVLNLSTSGSDVNVNKNHSITLQPGAYAELDAKKDTLIELVSGHYTFSAFSVDSGSEILLNLNGGPITVDVVGEMELDGVEMVAWNGSAQDVLFQVQGDKVKLGSYSEKSNNPLIGSYVGTFLAPNGKLSLESGATLTGAAFAQYVELKKQATLNPESALGLLIDASAQWLSMEVCLPEKSKSKSSKSKSKSKS